MILGVLSNFDISIGMKRFLGKARAQNDWLRFKQIVSTSALFTFLTSIIILIIALNPFFDILHQVGIKDQFVPMIVLIVVGNGLQHIFMETLVSALKSKSIILPSIVASISRFPILFAMFYFVGNSEISVAWAYSISYAVVSAILFLVTFRFLAGFSGKFFDETVIHLKTVIHGSLPRWFPQIISVLGSQLSILAIFALKGPSESGLFYIPFAIFNILFLISGAINMVSHPFLSGLNDVEVQKKFLRKALKMAFLGTMPFAGIMFFYAKPILSIFGPEYLVSNDILSILLYSFPIAIITEGVYYFLFAKGHYTKVLTIGLISNVSRIILYFFMVPSIGGIGAAYALVIGTVLQLVVTIVFIEKMQIRLQYWLFALISIIPFAIGYFFELINIGILGSILLFFISILIYLRLKLIKEDDIENILEMLLPEDKVVPVKDSLVLTLRRFHLM